MKKTTVVPIKDEKYKAETIEIMRQLIEDGKLTGNAQVSVYCMIIVLFVLHACTCIGDCWRSTNMQKFKSYEVLDVSRGSPYTMIKVGS